MAVYLCYLAIGVLLLLVTRRPSPGFTAGPVGPLRPAQLSAPQAPLAKVAPKLLSGDSEH